MMFWAIGYFVYDLGVLIHILMSLALITIGLRIFQERKLRTKLRGKYFK